MKTGWSKQIISREKTFLSGYRPIRKSSGIHDDVFVKVFAFKTEGNLTFFIMYDLIAVDEKFTKIIKSLVSDLFGYASKTIVSATHTHSAPVGTLNTSDGLLKNLDDVFGDWDEGYVSYITEQTKQAINESYNNMEECSVKIIEDRVGQVTSNRNDPLRFTDDRLFAMEFVSAEGKKALLCHISCHFTVLNSKNSLISKDLSYGVEQALPDYDMIGFWNGAAGDLSTRYTRKDSSVNQIIEFGKIISDKIKAILSNTPPTSINTFELKEHVFELNTVRSDSFSLTGRNSDEPTVISSYRDAQVEAGWKTHAKIIENTKQMTLHRITIQHLRINQFHFMTFPGELYSSLLGPVAYNLKLRIIGYANGYDLYLPDNLAFEEENYEALSSPFRKGEGERVAEVLKKLVITS